MVTRNRVSVFLSALAVSSLVLTSCGLSSQSKPEDPPPSAEVEEFPSLPDNSMKEAITEEYGMNKDLSQIEEIVESTIPINLTISVSGEGGVALSSGVKAADGKQYYRLDLQVTNNGIERTSIAIGDFKLIDTNGNLYNPAASVFGPGVLIRNGVNPRDTNASSVYFSIPDDATPVAVQYLSTIDEVTPTEPVEIELPEGSGQVQSNDALSPAGEDQGPGKVVP